MGGIDWWPLQTMPRAPHLWINERVQVTGGQHFAREGTLVDVTDGQATIELDRPLKGKLRIRVPVDDIRLVDVNYY